jgi:hypothetical protein
MKTKRKSIRTVLFLIILSAVLPECGEPLGPFQSPLIMYGVFPENYTWVKGIAIAKRNGGVFAAARRNAKYVVVNFQGTGFSEVFEVPYEIDNGWLNDIASAGSYIWAGGGKKDAAGVEAYLIRSYHGQAWEEVVLNTKKSGSITAVFPIGAEECWFIINPFSTSEEELRPGNLGRLKNGDVDILDGFGEVTCAVRTGVKESRSGAYSVYAVEFIGERARIGDPRVYLTKDGGVTWATESLDFDSPVGRDLDKVVAACASGDDLYVLVHFVNGYTGIVKRKGHPGNGNYELVFLAPIGPNFSNLNGLCVQGEVADPRRGLRGLAVGYETTVLYEGGIWYIEDASYPNDYKDVVVSPRGGFWVLAKDTAGLGRWELLYHR